jgi:endonuclease YncB( thermonuclease family)
MTVIRDRRSTRQRRIKARMWAALWMVLQISAAHASGPGQGTGVTAEGMSRPRAGPDCEIGGGERHSVVQVVDGQTLRLLGGREVRLTGALAPNAFDAAAETGRWPPADAARLALEQIAAGRDLRVVTSGRRTDRYGRLLAHVFVESGSGVVWVQGELLRAGHARAYLPDGGNACFAQLLASEAAARKTRAGLWSQTAYRVQSAAEVRSLLGLVGTFQLVEGRIVTVTGLRSAIYVNFGADWRTDFTISIRGAARREAMSRWTDLAVLGGRLLRVRGWIERRGGPLIDIQDLAEIEWLDGGARDRDGDGAISQRAGR